MFKNGRNQPPSNNNNEGACSMFVDTVRGRFSTIYKGTSVGLLIFNFWFYFKMKLN